MNEVQVSIVPCILEMATMFALYAYKSGFERGEESDFHSRIDLNVKKAAFARWANLHWGGTDAIGGRTGLPVHICANDTSFPGLSFRPGDPVDGVYVLASGGTRSVTFHGWIAESQINRETGCSFVPDELNPMLMLPPILKGRAIFEPAQV